MRSILLLAAIFFTTCWAAAFKAQPRTASGTLELSGQKQALAAVIRSRQYQFKRGRALASRAVVDDTCPSAPLPTVGCKTCNTCTGTVSTYCAITSTDINACGTCTKVKCTAPTSTQQVATCVGGTCGIACDSSKGFTGPPNNCADTSAVSHVKCPAQLPVPATAKPGTNPASQLTQTGYSQSNPVLQCDYRAQGFTGAGSNDVISCRYTTAQGTVVTEVVNNVQTTNKPPLYCSSSVPIASTSGSACFSARSCPQSITISGGKRALSDAAIQVATASSNGGTLICFYGGFSTRCTYSQSTGTFINGGSDTGLLTSSTCTPLDKSLAGYCSA